MSWINQGIYSELSDPSIVGYSSKNVEMCFRTLIVVLYFGDRKGFIDQIPMVFQLQVLLPFRVSVFLFASLCLCCPLLSCASSWDCNKVVDCC
jgi:hypothetical protein